MTIESTFVFVLVLTAVGCAALASVILWANRQTSRVLSLVDTSRSESARLWQKLDARTLQHSAKLQELAAQTPVALLARVDELAEDVERLRLTHQRFAGRFAQYVKDDARPDNSPPTLDREQLRRENAASIMPPGIRK